MKKKQKFKNHLFILSHILIEAKFNSSHRQRCVFFSFGGGGEGGKIEIKKVVVVKYARIKLLNFKHILDHLLLLQCPFESGLNMLFEIILLSKRRREGGGGWVRL
jgi:hypothetical protein